MVPSLPEALGHGASCKADLAQGLGTATVVTVAADLAMGPNMMGLEMGVCHNGASLRAAAAVSLAHHQ